jgi:hypothetical protein
MGGRIGVRRRPTKDERTKNYLTILSVPRVTTSDLAGGHGAYSLFVFSLVSLSSVDFDRESGE